MMNKAEFERKLAGLPVEEPDEIDRAAAFGVPAPGAARRLFLNI